MIIYNPSKELEDAIWIEGGFVNSHSHLDRAFTVTKESMASVVYNHLHQKWKYVDKYKTTATEEDYYNNITTALVGQRDLLTSHILSFIDLDPVVGTRALDAAVRAKNFANMLGVGFKIACQTLKGIMTPETQKLVVDALEEDKIDIIGSLPGADKGLEKEHVETVLMLGNIFEKRVHVHVDQLNTPKEKETELLARETMKMGMEGRVTAVHAISLACHPKWYRDEVYKMCKDAGLSFISCPTAWIDARRTEELTPTHNAITPVDELLKYDLTVALGSDNIHDVYKPYSTGDMRTELKFLLESTHLYDKATLIKIARENGLEVCGFNDTLKTRNIDKNEGQY
jgi:cytosine/adenosine deaminase-related metal-dependent hydrolase